MQAQSAIVKKMKILLVNNDSDTWDKLVRVVKAAGYEAMEVHHSAISSVDIQGLDLAILSGGWWYDDEIELLKNYAEELDFIRNTSIPVLGICLGMQLMHVAVDQAVPLMDEPQSGDKTITVSPAGQALFGFPEQMEVFKNHTRAVIETDPQFEQLASADGHVEIMKHKTRALLGVQFHPEMGPVDSAASRLQTLVIGLLKDRMMT